MLNKVMLMGNVGQDPKVRYFDNGVANAQITLATSESYKKDNERVTQTEWHNVVFWRGLAEVVEKYVKKGDRIFVEGKIRTRSYEQDGVKKYITEIIADNMQMLGSPRNGDQNSGQPAAPQQQTQAKAPSAEEPGDDLPF